MNEYSINFSLEQPDEYLAFFKEHGFVVIRDVFSPNEITSSIEEIWSSPNLLSSVPSINRNDPETWENDSWPAGGTQSRGFFNSLHEYDDQWMWKNRQKEEIVNVFRNIFGKDQLWVVMDRHGIMRPTKNIKMPDGSLINKPHWKTASSWLHWDQNPWREPNFVRVQGLFALTDHTITSGGFCCVPEFQKKFSEWGVEHPIETVPGAGWGQTLVYLPENDPAQKEKCAVLMKAGSLLVWDSRLPHQNYPNDDDQWRMVQYCTYMPVDPAQAKEKQEELVGKMLEGITGNKFPIFLNSLGRKLIGLDLCEGEDTSPKLYAPVPLNPKQKEALNFLTRAKDKEAGGNPTEAITYYKKALRLNPNLERYYM